MKDPEPLDTCAKRGCDALNPRWMSFGTRNGKTWCLGHVPHRARIRVWLQELRHP